MKRLLFILLLTSCAIVAQENRSYDGTFNNLNNPEWGSVGTNFLRIVSNGYADQVSEPGGENRENPRVISNVIGSQSDFMPNELELSDFVPAWGQFIDHDINLNHDDSSEPFDIAIPPCEPLFDPQCTGNQTITMFRSKSDLSTGTDPNNPRQTINEITAYLDGSVIYGSDETRANWIRSNVDGKIKMSNGGLLPWNTVDGEFDSAVDPNAPYMAAGGPVHPEKYFVSGDIRANEQPGLMALHTLFAREHNRLCDELKAENPSWNDEQLFQKARKIVGALIQVVTYEEFLPNMGIQLGAYNGYNPTVNAGIWNIFSAASYRFGHTTVNGRLVRFEENGDDWVFGAVDLRDGFFNPVILKDEGGIEPFFRGLAAQEHQQVDPLIMDDMRNFLFGPPGSGGLDLLAVNIARARERGLPDYNTIRADFQLEPHQSFNSLTSDPVLAANLASIYNDNVDDIDPWIGFMSEDHLNGSVIGEGLHRIVGKQFETLRDGDRYYYENDPAFTSDQIQELKSTTLSDIILRNTSIETLQENVFIAVPRELLAVELFPFPEIRTIKLSAYPNPVQKYFNLQIDASRETTARLTISELSGKIIQNDIINIKRGKNELSFELSDELANGLYIISFRSEIGEGQLKLIKK